MAHRCDIRKRRDRGSFVERVRIPTAVATGHSASSNTATNCAQTLSTYKDPKLVTNQMLARDANQNPVPTPPPVQNLVPTV